jgi:7-keto-8-aminopelargonate synthetase-like enzyme
MIVLKETPGRTCEIRGKEYLFFSGYSYLGMNHVKEFISRVKEGIKKYGVLYPSSRISNTRLDLYDKLESRLSVITGKEESVSFSSGFLAGKTISDILSSKGKIFCAPGTHPAIRIKGEHPLANDFIEWKKEVVNRINFPGENDFVLMADSVDILSASQHDFSFLQHIEPSKKIIFLVDDSHGIGITGKKGRGIVSQLPQLPNVEFIISYSLSKAFNIEGGAVSCSSNRAAELRAHPNYTGSTAINPSLAYAFIQCKDLYEEHREKLFENTRQLKDHLPSCFLQNHSELPIFMCRDEKAAELFFKKKMVISSFGYPDPASKKINRVILNALHTKRDIEKLAKVTF